MILAVENGPESILLRTLLYYLTQVSSPPAAGTLQEGTDASPVQAVRTLRMQHPYSASS